MSDTKTAPPSKNKILTLYGAFIISLMLSFVPSLSISLLAFVVFTGTLVMAYILRDKNDNDAFKNTHATHIIKTIWIGGLIIIISMFIAVIFMMSRIDQEAIMPCLLAMAEMMQNGDISQLMTLAENPQNIQIMLKDCWPNYWAANGTTFIISSAIAILPIVTFYIVQIVRGLRKAIKDQPI